MNSHQVYYIEIRESLVLFIRLTSSATAATVHRRYLSSFEEYYLYDKQFLESLDSSDFRPWKYIAWQRNLISSGRIFIDYKAAIYSTRSLKMCNFEKRLNAGVSVFLEADLKKRFK